MRNKKLINREKMTLHKDGSSTLLSIALEKAGEKGQDLTVVNTIFRLRPEPIRLVDLALSMRRVIRSP